IKPVFLTIRAFRDRLYKWRMTLNVSQVTFGRRGRNAARFYGRSAMKLEDLVIVSVDDHVIEPPDMFLRHMPKHLLDRAPQLKTAKDGSNYWVYEDRFVANPGVNAVAGRVPEEYGVEPTAL